MLKDAAAETGRDDTLRILDVAEIVDSGLQGGPAPSAGRERRS
jgi:hypothetical protein